MILFYIGNSVGGLKAAILFSMIFVAAEIIYKRRRKEKTSLIFKYTAAMTLIFGCIDLYLDQAVLLKYEAALTNILTAGLFAITLRSHRSIIQDFYEKQKDATAVTPAKNSYFRALTCVWVFYFLMKSAAYLWIGNNYSLEQGLFLRSILGSVSFYGLLAISIFGSKKIFPIYEKYYFKASRI